MSSGSLKRRLVTENSNLRKLKFGADRPYGGSSKQPFIREPLPGVLQNNPNIGLLGGAGEYVGLRQGTFKRTEDDIKRLSTFLLSTPQGAAFISKQNILSATNVKSVGRSIQNQGTYSPTSTLAQIGVAGIGGHALKQGLNPFKDTQTGGDSSDPTLFSKISDFVSGITDPLELPLYLSHKEEIKNVNTNRLVSLKNNKLSNTEPESLNINDLSDTISNFISGRNLLSSVINLDLKPNDDIELFSYSGGPNSVLGVGKTTIRRYSNSEEGLNTFTPGNFTLGTNSKYVPSKYNIQKDNVSLDTKTLGVTPKYLSQNPDSREELTEGFVGNNVKTFSNPETPNTLNKSQLKSQTSSKFNPKIKKDFRRDVANDKDNSIISDSLSYVNRNIEKRVNLGNPGQKGNRKNYVKGKEVAGKVVIADKINAMQIYQSNTHTQNEIKNDLCDFRISIIDPNGAEIGESFAKTYLHFRAFIDSFNDNMDAQWEGEKYMGRGENFYRYNGFDRTIQMAFTVAAQSKGELMPMYNKLNYLQSAMAPNYTSNGYYFGNLVKMRVGGYLYEMPGVINNLSYTIPETAPWEIAISNEETETEEGVPKFTDTTTQVVPHIINVNLTFKPIHKFAPRLQQNVYGNNTVVEKFGNEQFISLGRGEGITYTGYNTITGVNPQNGEKITTKDSIVNE